MKSPGRHRATATDIHVGNRLRMRRLALRLSQTDLGELIGVTFQQVQKYEKGVNRLRVGTLQRLGAALQIPITYFLEGAPQENIRTSGGEAEWTELLATPDAFALLRAFKRVQSAELRRAMIDLVEQVAKKHEASG